MSRRPVKARTPTVEATPAIVAAVAAKVADEKGERLPTFAVGTEGSADLLAARAVAEHQLDRLAGGQGAG